MHTPHPVPFLTLQMLCTEQNPLLTSQEHVGPAVHMQWSDQEKGEERAKAPDLLPASLSDCAHAAWQQAKPFTPGWGEGDMSHQCPGEGGGGTDVTGADPVLDSMQQAGGKTTHPTSHSPSSPHTGSHREEPPGEKSWPGLPGAATQRLHAETL